MFTLKIVSRLFPLVYARYVAHVSGLGSFGYTRTYTVNKHSSYAVSVMSPSAHAPAPAQCNSVLKTYMTPALFSIIEISRLTRGGAVPFLDPALECAPQ